MEEIIAMLNEIRPEHDFASSEDYIEDGLIDSFDIITLINMLEEKYNISIDGIDIIPENFNTAENIAELVRKSGGNI